MRTRSDRYAEAIEDFESRMKWERAGDHECEPDAEHAKEPQQPKGDAKGNGAGRRTGQ